MNDCIREYGWLVPDWPAPANVHAVVTTRRGGVSQGPYQGMNLAAHVGDEAGAVAENRRRLRDCLGLAAEPLWLSQVHGTRIVDVAGAAQDEEADGSISTLVGRACVVMTADCLPVLLCDRAGTRVAAVHAGWRGLVAGAVEAAVARLAGEPGELLAWLGPAIGPGNFEVGDEVRQAFLERDSGCAEAFRPHGDGKWLADIYQLARRRLAGVGVSRVYGGGACTFDEAERFYSYRRDRTTGRMASLVWFD
jgi:YfiH family protein